MSPTANALNSSGSSKVTRYVVAPAPMNGLPVLYQTPVPIPTDVVNPTGTDFSDFVVLPEQELFYL